MTVTATRRATAPVRRTTERGGWRLAVALGVLAVTPLVAGALRLLQLVGGPALMPDDPRFDAFPVALVVHIVGSAAFALAGAGQFVPRLRQGDWHRRAGRVVAAAGLLVVGSALWLTLLYEAQPGTGDLLFGFRLAFASAMGAALVLGLAAIRRRDVAGHRAWMTRAYAIGLGAGTQALTEGFGEAIFGTGIVAGDLEKGAAWMINVAIAEWVIRRHARRTTTVVEPA